MTTPFENPDLWLGIEALQMGYLQSDALLEALKSWASLKTKSLSEILVERSCIKPDRIELLKVLIADRCNEAPKERSSERFPTRTDSHVPPPLRYITQKHLKDGGLGRLFEAHDHELNRTVALKEIKDLKNAYDLEIRSLFKREAEITGGLEHPGVVPVYGLGVYPDGRPYYAMRLIHGETLADAISKVHDPAQAGDDPARLAAALRQLMTRFVNVCNTIAYAHSRGVLHLDLKPINIMLGPFGETLVLDWGLAQVIENADSGPSQLQPIKPGSGSSGKKSGGGTRAYMAPEQRVSSNVTVRTDVYLLGGTLYEILTGKPPHFQRDKANDSVELATVLNPSAPAELAQIAARALDPDPSERFHSAQLLAIEIERWLAEEPLAAYRSYVSGLQALHDAHLKVVDYAERLARARVTLGMMLEGMHRPNDARKEIGQAVEIFERLQREHPREPRYIADLATSRVDLSRIHALLNQPEEAKRLQELAVSEFKNLLVNYPDDYHTNLASVMLTVAPGFDFRAEKPERAESTPETGMAQPPELPTVNFLAPDAGGSVRAVDEEFKTLPPEESIRDEAYPDSDRSETRARLSILRPFATGGMARILVARDNDLEREVALKELSPQFTSSEARKRLVREAIITAGLEHPNIIPVYGLGHRSHDGSPFITMRLVAGKTLRETIASFHETEKGGSKTSVQFNRLLRIVTDVCGALDYAHANGVIHRDPKPANILLGKCEEVYLLDWGLARAVGRPELEDEADGSVVGTIAYMAPEMAAGMIDKFGPQTDVYVLGATLFHVLTGSPPHYTKDADQFHTLQAIIKGPTPLANQRSKSVPAELSAICAKAMAKEPTERYHSMRDFKADLQRWLNDEPVSAYHDSFFGKVKRKLRRIRLF